MENLPEIKLAVIEKGPGKVRLELEDLYMIGQGEQRPVWLGCHCPQLAKMKNRKFWQRMWRSPPRAALRSLQGDWRRGNISWRRKWSIA